MNNTNTTLFYGVILSEKDRDSIVDQIDKFHDRLLEISQNNQGNVFPVSLMILDSDLKQHINIALSVYIVDSDNPSAGLNPQNAPYDIWNNSLLETLDKLGLSGYSNKNFHWQFFVQNKI